ncbi:MAG: hypothetical protein ACE5PV_20035 [Candidatus Poribacteria bacterium]
MTHREHSHNEIARYYFFRFKRPFLIKNWRDSEACGAWNPDYAVGGTRDGDKESYFAYIAPAILYLRWTRLSRMNKKHGHYCQTPLTQTSGTQNIRQHLIRSCEVEIVQRNIHFGAESR